MGRRRRRRPRRRRGRPRQRPARRERRRAVRPQAGLAHRRAGGGVLLRVQQPGALAGLSRDAEPNPWPRGGLGDVQRGERAVRRRGRGAGLVGGRRVAPGLPLRTRAAAGPCSRSRRRLDRPVLARPVAGVGHVPGLSPRRKGVARTARKRPLRRPRPPVPGELPRVRRRGPPRSPDRLGPWSRLPPRRRHDRHGVPAGRGHRDDRPAGGRRRGRSAVFGVRGHPRDRRGRHRRRRRRPPRLHEGDPEPTRRARTPVARASRVARRPHARTGRNRVAVADPRVPAASGAGHRARRAAQRRVRDARLAAGRLHDRASVERDAVFAVPPRRRRRRQPDP